jgi:hypothetical protein
MLFDRPRKACAGTLMPRAAIEEYTQFIGFED